jgi:predicted RNA methylase
LSATGRGSARFSRDFYETPVGLTRAIVKVLANIAPFDSVLDPCCGNGNILEAALSMVLKLRVYGLEIDPIHATFAEVSLKRVCGQVESADALSLDCVWPKADVCIMNPPYSHIMQFVERALREVPRVACFASLTFLASKRRVEFWRKHPADVYVVSPRPSFIQSIKCKKQCGYADILALDCSRPSKCPKCGLGVSVSTSDASEYMWCVWDRNSSGGRWQTLTWEQ